MISPDVLHRVHVEGPEDGPDVSLVAGPGAGDLPDHGAGLADVVVAVVAVVVEVVNVLGVTLLRNLI